MTETPLQHLGCQFQILEVRDADRASSSRWVMHQLIIADDSGLQIQVGDKRWFKGADRDAKGIWNSFTVA